MKFQATSVFIPSYLAEKAVVVHDPSVDPKIYPRNVAAFNTSRKWEGLNGWTGGSCTTLKRLGHRYKVPSCWHSCSVLIKTFRMRPGFYPLRWPGCPNLLQRALSPGVDICICAALHWPPCSLVSPVASLNVCPPTLAAQAIFFLPVKGFSNYVKFCNDARSDRHSLANSICAAVHHRTKYPSPVKEQNSITKLAGQTQTIGKLGQLSLTRS